MSQKKSHVVIVSPEGNEDTHNFIKRRLEAEAEARDLPLVVSVAILAESAKPATATEDALRILAELTQSDEKVFLLTTKLGTGYIYAIREAAKYDIPAASIWIVAPNHSQEKIEQVGARHVFDGDLHMSLNELVKQVFEGTEQQ